MKNTMLKRKQSINNDDWLDAVSNIENIVSKEEIDKLVSVTIKQMKKETNRKNVAYAWSGGKDSIVLGKICESINIDKCMIGICDLEYREFLEWVNDNKPKNCTIVNTKQDIEWLKKHPQMLFPQSSTIASKWFSIVQHKAQKQYYKDNNLDMILLGRRKADGNYVGKQSNIYTDGKGVTRFSPLSDWKHEHILAYIHYYSLSLPPFYKWGNGYKCGTHAWPARQYTGNVQKAWDEVIAIQPDLINIKTELEGTNEND